MYLNLGSKFIYQYKCFGNKYYTLCFAGIFIKRLTCLYSTRERLRIVGVLLEKVIFCLMTFKIFIVTTFYFI